MKIFICADVEGATGVVSYERQSHPEAYHYQEARESFMSDLNSAIEGASRGGAKEVVVYDMHCWGLNIMIDKLHPSAKAILGKPNVVPPDNGLDDSFDGFMLVGLHTKAETAGGLLTHTYDLDIKDLAINGTSVGEIGMEIALAGEFGVPAIFISGDSKAIEEATAFSENIQAACVKQPVTNLSALCLPTEVTAKLIRQKAEEAVRNISSFRPYRVDYPVTVEIEYYDNDKAQEKLKIPGVTPVAANKVAAKADTLRQAWSKLKPD